MKCSCCDKELSDKEIVFNPEIGTWELCTTCLDVAMETAYSDGFQKEDDEFVLIEEDEPDQFSFMSWFRKEGANDNDND